MQVKNLKWQKAGNLKGEWGHVKTTGPVFVGTGAQVHTQSWSGWGAVLEAATRESGEADEGDWQSEEGDTGKEAERAT